MKLKLYLERIQSLYAKGVPSQSSRLSARHVYYTLKTIRETMYDRFFEKNRMPNEADYSTIYNMPLEKVPGCKNRRTKYKVPLPVRIDLLQVMSSDGLSIYSKVKKNEVKFLSGGRFSNSRPLWYWDDGYIYVINSKASIIGFKGVFKDVIEVHKLKVLLGEADKCMSFKQVDLPAESNFADVIVSETAKELIDTFNRFGREDLTNNAIDTPVNEAK